MNELVPPASSPFVPCVGQNLLLSFNAAVLFLAGSTSPVDRLIHATATKVPVKLESQRGR
jgi:hypothetical protein